MTRVVIKSGFAIAPLSRPNRPEVDQFEPNGNMLGLIKEDITAATYDSGQGTLTLGMGKVNLVSYVGGDLKKYDALADVYNFALTSFPASESSVVAVHRNEDDLKLYVVGGGGGDELYQFTALEDMGATTAGEMSSTVVKAGGGGSTTENVKDHPGGIFASLVTGNVGWAIKVGSDYWIIQSDCPPPAFEESTGDGSLQGQGTFIQM